MTDDETTKSNSSGGDGGGSAAECFRRLLAEGKQVEATSQQVDISKRPEYFDPERFKRAQQTCSKYYTNLSLGSSTGLMLLLQIESILVPLIKTGKSLTVAHLYDRYTATGKFIRKYYESDFYEPDSEGWKCIKLVRTMHQRIHKYMQEDQELGPVQTNGDLWVNQHDMAITQWAFIGLFLMFPQRCVAYHIAGHELSDVAYYWRLISYYLGIEERFNIFSMCDDLDEQVKLMRLLMDHVNELRTQMKQDTGRRMAEGFMFAFEDLNAESNFNILNHWWSPCFSLSGDHKLAPYTLSDRWKLIFFKFYFTVLFRSETLMSFMNVMYKRKFEMFCEASDKIRPKLEGKYKHITYEL